MAVFQALLLLHSLEVVGRSVIRFSSNMLLWNLHLKADACVLGHH